MDALLKAKDEADRGLEEARQLQQTLQHTISKREAEVEREQRRRERVEKEFKDVSAKLSNKVRGCSAMPCNAMRPVCTSLYLRHSPGYTSKHACMLDRCSAIYHESSVAQDADVRVVQQMLVLMACAGGGAERHEQAADRRQAADRLPGAAAQRGASRLIASC
jgi:hypothetical protein